jgi:hypothetical protein
MRSDRLSCPPDAVKVPDNTALPVDDSHVGCVRQQPAPPAIQFEAAVYARWTVDFDGIVRGC